VVYKCETFFKKSNFSTHAVRVITLENIEDIWDNDHSFLSFKVIAKHGLSNFSKVIKKTYDHKVSIVAGEFEYGNSMKIVS